MAIAKAERELVRNNKGCLGKAADDEPIFILRGQDRFFVPLVRLWLELVAGASLSDNQKVVEARELAHYALTWQQYNQTKTPD